MPYIFVEDVHDSLPGYKKKDYESNGVDRDMMRGNDLNHTHRLQSIGVGEKLWAVLD